MGKHLARPQQLLSITNAMIVSVTISGRVEERTEVDPPAPPRLAGRDLAGEGVGSKWQLPCHRPHVQ